MKLTNKKGFTLIELLAVIVILAIIILIAMPAVINVMEQSQASAFKNEVNETKGIFETSYSKEYLKNSSKIKTIKIGEKSYRYMCKTLADLTKDGDTEKPYDKSTNYQGKYEVFVPVDGGSALYYIHFTNGQFTVPGLYYSTTSSDAYKPEYSALGNEFNTCTSTPETTYSSGLPTESGVKTE